MAAARQPLHQLGGQRQWPGGGRMQQPRVCLAAARWVLVLKLVSVRHGKH